MWAEGRIEWAEEEFEWVEGQVEWAEEEFEWVEDVNKQIQVTADSLRLVDR